MNHVLYDIPFGLDGLGLWKLSSLIQGKKYELRCKVAFLYLKGVYVAVNPRMFGRWHTHFRTD